MNKPGTPPEGIATERLGTYWHRPTFDAARSAYLVDLDHDPTPATSFARWIAKVIRAHAELTPQARAMAAAAAPSEPSTGSGFSRSFDIPTDVITMMTEAITADRREGSGRVMGASQFAGEAIRVAISKARSLAGGQLPPAPARLPNKPR